MIEKLEKEKRVKLYILFILGIFYYLCNEKENILEKIETEK